MNTEAALHQGVLATEEQEGTLQFLTFMLGEEEYGVDILDVQEIRSWENPTPIPNTPVYVLGVINLRGLVVPIVDLRKRFELEKAEFDSATIIVIVKLKLDNHSSRTVGMVVDEVSDVYNIPVSEIREMPSLGSAIASRFIQGVATVNEKMVVILDIQLLINAGVLGEANAPGPENDEAAADAG